MRTFFITALFVLVAISFSSCSSSQTFFVNGYPGTIIATPDGNALAQIDHSGTTQITLNRDGGYYHYLLAKAPNSDLPVPFALDYKDHNRNGGKYALEGIGGTVGFAGGVATIGCLAAAIGTGLAKDADKEDKKFSEKFFGLGLAGLGVTLGGAGIWAGGNSMSQEKRNYDYLPQQTTNNDIIQ